MASAAKTPARIIFFAVIGLLAVAIFPVRAFGAMLFLSPAAESVAVGRTFVVAVDVSSPDQAMNAASGDISFPSDKVQVLSVSKDGSIMSLWTRDPSFSNSVNGGNVHFEGVVLNPGFTGSAGDIVKVVFQAVAAGTAKISFSSGAVLANDGSGTNILTSMKGASAVVVPVSGASLSTPPTSPTVVLAPIVTSATHPDENNWYNTTTLELSWPLPQGVTGVSYVLSSSTDITLSSESRGLLSGATYDLSGYADGIWYFYVKFETRNGWGATTTRRVNMDFSPPEPFTVSEVLGYDPTYPRPIFTWEATDTVSGIARYMMKVADGDWFDPASIRQGSLYMLPPQSPTQSRTLAVRAYDHAGNFRDATINFRTIGQQSCSGTNIICSLEAFFAVWGWLWIVILVPCLFVAYWFMYRASLARRKLRTELADFKNELRRDLKRLEERVDVGVGKGTEVDLRPSHLAARKGSLEKMTQQIETEVQEEIKKIEKL